MVILRRLLFLLMVLAVAPSALAKPRVIVILSEAREISLRDGKKAETGVYLNELMIPVMALLDRRHALAFATPNGKSPAIDPSSDNLKYFGNDEKKLRRARRLLTKLWLTGSKASVLRFSDLSKLEMASVSAIFVPGGHAPVVDLAGNRELGAFLRRAHEKNVPTTLICHGPVAVLSALEAPSAFLSAMEADDIDRARAVAAGWIYKGYRMSVFSTPEEKMAEEKKLKGRMPYYPAEALAAAGGSMVLSDPGKANVVLDRELLTGQNPASADEFAQALVKLLDGRK